MDSQLKDDVTPGPYVKVKFCLESEKYEVEVSKGILSEQLVSMKDQSMSVLKEFITKHNIPTDVPDEPNDVSSEDEGEEVDNPPVKSKKRK